MEPSGPVTFDPQETTIVSLYTSSPYSVLLSKGPAGVVVTGGAVKRRHVEASVPVVK